MIARADGRLWCHGRWRTPEAAARKVAQNTARKQWDNERRVFCFGYYGFTARTPELARECELEALEKLGPSMLALQEKQAEERRHLNEWLANAAPEELLARAMKSPMFSLEGTRFCD